MAYYGENRNFSFREGFCEPLPGAQISFTEAAELGRIAAAGLPDCRRFCAGCDSFRHTGLVHSFCCGISESGRDVYLCDNTDLPSLRFSLPLLSADCGVFFGGDSGLRLSFFRRNGFPLSPDQMRAIVNTSPEPRSWGMKPGRMMTSYSFRDIYVFSIADSLPGTLVSIPAGVSCGSRSVRSLWLEFFSGQDDELVFQVSGDGQHVNAYSSSDGFISHEKLILAYSVLRSQNGQAVFLPESFHYSATDIPADVNFFPDGSPTAEAVSQRFLTDPLYLCTNLAQDRDAFRTALQSLPDMASVRREITVDAPGSVSGDFRENAGRVIVSRCGKSSLSLIAQAESMEAASELCSLWTDRLRRQCNRR